MASEAELHGDVQYEHGGGKDNIGYWTNPDDWAEWKFKVTQPGKMQVSAEIAATRRLYENPETRRRVSAFLDKSAPTNQEKS